MSVAVRRKTADSRDRLMKAEEPMLYLRPIHSTMVRRGLFYFIYLLFLCSSASAANVVLQSDPKDDPQNPMKYIPSNVLTAIAICLILLTAVIQTLFYRKLGGRCMLSMVIANSKTFLLCYRLAHSSRPTRHHTPRRITLFFVLSDVTTFLMQAAGGGLSIIHSASVLNIGKNLFLAGLSLQLASFVIFFCISLLFFFRVKRLEPQIWHQDTMKPFMYDWRALAAALTLGSICIAIRCVYRTIELSQGYSGRLATSEAFFYALDTLPLFISVAVYIPFWPARMLPGVDARIKDYVLAESDPNTIELQPNARHRRR
ncbi:Protein RTA1 [Grifola frondosa]|uniref:Protein RTA1 n=1 Tax=Grifola frondosa TaxID=5627 RepID=A0A1C7MY73_GRIFR|nr:Protein RTA1 [Grifola frondosa]